MSNGGWRTVRVGAVARVIGGATPSTADESLWGGDIPWLTPKDLSDRPARYTSVGSRSLTEEGLDSCSAVLVPKGTVLLTSRAPIGYVSIAGQALATNQGFKSLALNADQDPLFWYYLLRDSTEYLESRANGSTFKEISGSVVKDLQFRVPPLAEQRRIAGVLGALDDLIEVNRGLIADFDALRRAASASLLDEASASIPLSSAARFVNGKNFTKDASGSGRPVIRTPELRQGPNGGTVWNNVEAASDFVARAGDILFVWSGSLMIDRWIHEEGLVNQHIFKVVPQPGIPDWLVYAQIEYQMPWFLGLAADKATTMGHIQRGHLDADVPMPSADALAGAAAGIAPLWDAQLQLSLENRELARTRDELLPLLMSGRVRVAEAVAA